MAELEADGMAADLQSFSATELVALTRSDATVAALDALIRLGEAAEPARSEAECHRARGACHSLPRSRRPIS